MFIEDGVMYKYDPKDVTDGLLIIPDEVHTIAPYCGKDCFGLKVITITDNVKKIEEYAFNDCPDLELVTFTEKANVQVSERAFINNAVRVDMIVHGGVNFFS